MKAVLIRVSRSCESPWVSVNRASQVRVRGLEGGSVVDLLFGESETVEVDEDGDYPLPEGVSVMKARVGVVEGFVTVDLE